MRTAILGLAGTVAAATIAAIVAIALQFIQARSALELEARREQTSLILLALNAPTNAERIANLKFFREAGLLTAGKELDALIAANKQLPFVASPQRHTMTPRVGQPTKLSDCKRPETEAEMKLFQKSHGIQPSGLWNNETQAAVEAMEAQCGIPYTPSLDFSDPRNSGLM